MLAVHLETHLAGLVDEGLEVVVCAGSGNPHITASLPDIYLLQRTGDRGLEQHVAACRPYIDNDVRETNVLDALQIRGYPVLVVLVVTEIGRRVNPHVPRLACLFRRFLGLRFRFVPVGVPRVILGTSAGHDCHGGKNDQGIYPQRVHLTISLCNPQNSHRGLPNSGRSSTDTS